MSSAQAWTLIGTLLAAVFASVAGTSLLVLRVIDARIDGLRNEMVARFDGLERDLQRLYERVFHAGDGRS